MKQSRNTKPRMAVTLALAALVAASVGIVTSGASRAATSDLPKACTLLTHDEAQELADADKAGVELGAAQLVTDDFCEWDNPPGGYTAQVEIFIGESAKKTLDLERKNVVPVANLGDEAYEEEGYIFGRKGSVWIEIHLVRLAEWDPFWQAMRDAMAKALSRVPAGASATPKTKAPPKTVTRVPRGGGSNPLWPGNQKRFGGNLDQLKDVVYQPNVIRIGGGAGSIRNVSSDGLTWTVAASAPGAGKLRVGTIMAATTLAVGRVLALKRVGPNLLVTIGPVGLTDLFRKAEFRGKGAALKQPLYYKTALPTHEAARSPQATRPVDGGTLFSYDICCTSIGLGMSYSHPAGLLFGKIQFEVPKPSVDFDIVIDNGLKEAKLRINSATSLDFQFKAATKNVDGNFKLDRQLLDGSISIPLGSGIALTLTHVLQMSMGLAGAASMETSGVYTLNGNLGFTYTKNGGARVDGAAFASSKNVLDYTTSVGVGQSRLIVNWSLRATLGIGLAGLSAGAFYEIRPGVDVVHNGNSGNLYPNCVIANFGITSDYGVGYTLPSFVLKLVNAVLEARGADPIKLAGGKGFGPATLLPRKTAAKCPPGVQPPPTV